MPIRQKVRPLLLLKKQLGHFQRVGTNTLAIGNRLQGVGTGPGQTGLRALSLAASVGSDDVTVNFNEDVVVTDPTSGVSITVNGQAATFTAVKGTRSMVYTLTSQNPIDYDDVIVWTYDSTAAGADPYIGEDSGEELADSTLSRTMPSEPPGPISDVEVIGGWTGEENCEETPVDPTLELELPLTSSLTPSVGSAVPSFARNSIATVHDANGLVVTVAANEARFEGSIRNAENDWSDNVNSQGILIERERTNVLLHSEDYANAVWIQDGLSVLNNDTTAPDGTVTAQALLLAAVNQEHRIYQQITDQAAIHTQTVYAKAGTVDFISLNYANRGREYTVFDLNQGIVSSSTAQASSIEAIGNGWYRCSHTSSSIDVRFGCITAGDTAINAEPGNAWTPVGTEKVYVWGHQLELGDYATSYIPTTTATVTRATDVLTYAYQPPALLGSMAASIRTLNAIDTGRGLKSYIGNNPDCRHVNGQMNLARLRSYDGTSQLAYGDAVDGVQSRYGLTWEDGGAPEVALYQDGTQTLTGALDADGFDPLTNPLGIGAAGSDQSGPINANFRDIKFWTEAKDQTFMENETS